MKTQVFTITCAAAMIGAFVLSPAQAQSPQQNRMKECASEWGSLKAANQTQGKTYRDFQKECLAKGAAAQPAAPAPTPAATTPAATPAAAPTTPPAPAATKRAAKAAATQPAAAATGQFQSEAAAKGHCPSDTVVWVNLNSKVYHYSGNKAYGTTKKGAYMCEQETTSAGFRAAKNEKKGT
jgi:hypothetical protein